MAIKARSKEFGGEHIGDGGGPLLAPPRHYRHDRLAGGLVGHNRLDDANRFGKRMRRVSGIT
jgi:hypothetical protein